MLSVFKRKQLPSGTREGVRENFALFGSPRAVKAVIKSARDLLGNFKVLNGGKAPKGFAPLVVSAIAGESIPVFEAGIFSEGELEILLSILKKWEPAGDSGRVEEIEEEEFASAFFQDIHASAREWSLGRYIVIGFCAIVIIGVLTWIVKQILAAGEQAVYDQMDDVEKQIASNSKKPVWEIQYLATAAYQAAGEFGRYLTGWGASVAAPSIAGKSVTVQNWLSANSASYSTLSYAAKGTFARAFMTNVTRIGFNGVLTIPYRLFQLLYYRNAPSVRALRSQKTSMLIGGVGLAFWGLMATDLYQTFWTYRGSEVVSDMITQYYTMQAKNLADQEQWSLLPGKVSALISSINPSANSTSVGGELVSGAVGAVTGFGAVFGVGLETIGALAAIGTTWYASNRIAELKGERQATDFKLGIFQKLIDKIVPVATLGFTYDTVEPFVDVFIREERDARFIGAQFDATESSLDDPYNTAVLRGPEPEPEPEPEQAIVPSTTSTPISEQPPTLLQQKIIAARVNHQRRTGSSLVRVRRSKS